MSQSELVEMKISGSLLEKVEVIVENSDCFDTVREFVLTALLQGLVQASLDEPSSGRRGA